MKKRWGEEVSKHGWTAVPAILIQNQRLLSLSATDLAVILQLEHHRRDPAKPVWPGVRTMAAQSGLSERTVRTRISTLEKRGLIEVRATRRSEGGTTSSRYTADGLRKVLALLAKNEAAKVEVDHGLEALLARLAAKGEAEHTARREADAKDAEVISILQRRRAAKSA